MKKTAWKINRTKLILMLALLLVLLVVLFLVTYVPQISLFLPKLLGT